MILKDRVALITGSTGGGMGRSTALTLAKNGADIVLNYGTNRRDAEADKSSKSVEKAIRDLGRREPGAIPLAWAANGTCSVLGTILALVLATGIGFRNLSLLALALYFVAAMANQISRAGGKNSSAHRVVDVGR